MKKVVHLGDPGIGRIVCGAAEVKKKYFGCIERNWTWKPELVTCKRCLAIYRKRVADNHPTKARQEE